MTLDECLFDELFGDLKFLSFFLCLCRALRPHGRPMQNCVYAIVLSTYTETNLLESQIVIAQHRAAAQPQKNDVPRLLLSPIFSTIFTVQYVPRPIEGFFAKQKRQFRA